MVCAGWLYKAAVALVISCALVGRAPAQETVGWRDAATCVGHVCSVAGTVAVAEDDGAVIRLFFDAERRDVAVILMRAWFTSWPSYTGVEIVATGRVERFRDRIEIMARNPGAITLRAPAPEPNASRTIVPTHSPSVPTTATVPLEVDRLRQRVRELEEQVRELKR